MHLNIQKNLKVLIILPFIFSASLSALSMEVNFPGCLADSRTNYCKYKSHSFLLPDGAWVESIMFSAHDDIGFNHNARISVTLAGREILNESVRKRGSNHEAYLGVNIPKGTPEHERLVRIEAQFDDVMLEYARVSYFVEE